MSLDKFVGRDEEFEIKEPRRRGRLAKIEEDEETETKSRRPKQVRDYGLLNFLVAGIVILGLIGLVFGYAKDRIKEVDQGGKGLEAQMQTLKSELADLKAKADNLEQENLTNKSAVIDLFEKQRSIPRNINTVDWQILAEKDLSFVLSFPKTWEKVNAVVSAPKDGGLSSELVYLQPIGQDDFANALTIKSDYADFANLKMEEKLGLFKDLFLIDKIETPEMSMLYFLNLDENNLEIPTIMVLTPNKIYRATFNISDKKLNNYFEYRKNFEEIVATFKLVKVEDPAKGEEKVDPNKKN